MAGQNRNQMSNPDRKIFLNTAASKKLQTVIDLFSSVEDSGCTAEYLSL